MAKTKEKQQEVKQEEEIMEEPKESKEEEEEEEVTFEELGLDPRLIRALNKKEISVTKPTPIQRVAIPLILVSFYQIPLHFFFKIFVELIDRC